MVDEQAGEYETPDMRSECPICGREKADARDCESNYHNSPIGDPEPGSDD